MINRIVGACAGRGAACRNTNNLYSFALGFGMTLAGVCGTIVASQPVAAQPQISASAPGVHVPAPPPSGKRPFLAPVVSSYLAGYQITEPGISRASVSFIVPAMNCPTTET